MSNVLSGSDTLPLVVLEACWTLAGRVLLFSRRCFVYMQMYMQACIYVCMWWFMSLPGINVLIFIVKCENVKRMFTSCIDMDTLQQLPGEFADLKRFH